MPNECVLWRRYRYSPPVCFNENYYALPAALWWRGSQEYSLVVLPGDLMDNGQSSSINKNKEYIVSVHAKKRYAFLWLQVIMIRLFRWGSMQKECAFSGSRWKPWRVRIRSAGYVSQMECAPILAFSPEGRLLLGKSFYFYTYDKYSYEDACRESALSKRTYTLCGFADGYGCQLPGRTGRRTWLLAIDGGSLSSKRNEGWKVELSRFQCRIQLCTET